MAPDPDVNPASDPDESPREASLADSLFTPASGGAVDFVPGPDLSLAFEPTPDVIYQASLTVDILCLVPGAEIRYALDAADVDEEGLLFDPEEKIHLTQSTKIAVRAFHEGQPGPLLTGQFDIRKPVWLEREPEDQSDPAPHKLGENLSHSDGWRTAAGSVRGKLHAHRALWREDSFALADVATPDGTWSIIAVSDGAGSASLSRIGSRLACEAAIGSLQESLPQISDLSPEQDDLITEDLPKLRGALVNSGVAALESIRADAAAREQSVSAFAATLLVLVRRPWNGAQIFAALQVGDGAVALWNGDTLTLLGDADHGEHSSETRFLTTSGIEAEFATRVRFSLKDDLVALAVMSDGVADDYFPEEKRLGDMFSAVLPLLETNDDPGAAIIEWLGYEKKGSSDDRTLVISWPGTSQETSSG